MASTELDLDEAVAVTRTGDLWLLRDRTAADRTIRVVTNGPVNHVRMSVVIEDLPPLLWHAELAGPSLVSDSPHPTSCQQAPTLSGTSTSEAVVDVFDAPIPARNITDHHPTIHSHRRSRGNTWSKPGAR